MLLRLFQRLVDRGHSLVVIEHNLEVIKCADWIVDLGPEAGDAGGEVVAVGTPEQVARVEHSHTGKFLRRELLETLKALAAVFGTAPKRRPGTSQNLDGEGEILAYAPRRSVELARAAETAPRFRVSRSNGAIQVHGAREHNLKNIDVKIPREQLVVITGLKRLRKIDSRVRHLVCRRAAPFSRQHVAVCATIRGATRKT